MALKQSESARQFPEKHRGIWRKVGDESVAPKTQTQLISHFRKKGRREAVLSNSVLNLSAASKTLA